MKKVVIIIVIICIMLVQASCGYIIKNGDSHAFRGINLYNDGKILEAVDKFKKAIELGVKDYELKEIYTILGNCYTDLDMYEKAIEMHKESIKLDSDFVSSWVNLGVAYRQSGNFDEAEKCYSKALKISPQYAELRSSLGSLYILKNEPEKAIQEFEKAMELNPNLATPYGNGALAYAMVGRFEKAEELLKQSKVLGYKNASAIQERIDLLKN